MKKKKNVFPYMKANALYMEEGEINVGGPESGIILYSAGPMISLRK